jgi:lipopolysaccharide biosynthesis glycosyltransferase
MHDAVLVIATGKLPYLDTTLPRLIEFSRRMGANFNLVSMNPYGVPATWLKVALLSNFCRAERLTILDADLMPNFAALTEEDYANLRTGDIAMAPDQGMPKRDARFVKWCKKHLGMEMTTGGTYYNAGVMSLSGTTIRALNRAFEAYKITPDEYFHEQDFVNAFITANGSTVNQLPVTFNWLAPQVIADPETTNAKIIHFAGSLKSHMPRFDAVLPR